MKISKTFILLLVILCGFSGFTAGASAAALSAGSRADAGTPDDFEQMIQKFSNDYTVAKNQTFVNNLLAKFKSDGSFNDIDYSSTAKTKWPCEAHLNNTFILAQTYANKGGMKGNEEVYNAINKALKYWTSKEPKSDNWWYNVIKTPQILTKILVKMRTAPKQLDASVEKSVLRLIEAQYNDPAHATGANLTDQASNWILHACLVKDRDELTESLDKFFGVLVYTEDEGFQYDFTVHQHGPQIYIGGYGEELAKSSTQMAYYTAGTAFAPSGEQLDVLRNFLLKAYFPVIRGNVMAFDVMGRSVSREGATLKDASAVFAERMEIIDSDNVQEYKDIASRIKQQTDASYAVEPVNRHFFRSDYTLHTRPDYTFDVRMVSKRTSRCEKGNNENLKGYFLSDGCTSIRMEGDEYFDIFPVWDWTHIPGTTTAVTVFFPKVTDWQEPGTSTFVGGVSDGKTGVSVYQYNDKNGEVSTSANKAWFCFDKEIVCLGSAIRGNVSGKEIHTTLDQCLLGDGEIYVCDGGNVSTTSGAYKTFTSPEWVLHNGIGYFLPSGGELRVAAEERSGSWYDINQSQSNSIVKKNVFTACLSHGIRPQDAEYAYIIVPGVGTPEEAGTYAAGNSVSVLKNTAAVQAVRSNELGQTGVVFYQSGNFVCDKFDVTVSAPCALLVKDNGEFSIADPAQKESEITVKIKMAGSDEKTIKCDFRHTGVYAGDSKHYNAGGSEGGIAGVVADGEVSVSVENGRIIVANCTPKTHVRVFDISGRIVYSGNSAVVDCLDKGHYCVSVGGKTTKVSL